jgi:hypothetical protein
MRDNDLTFLLKAFAFSLFLLCSFTLFFFVSSRRRRKEGGAGCCLVVVVLKVTGSRLRSLWVFGGSGQTAQACLFGNKMRDSQAGSVQLGS